MVLSRSWCFIPESFTGNILHAVISPSNLSIMNVPAGTGSSGLVFLSRVQSQDRGWGMDVTWGNQKNHVYPRCCFFLFLILILVLLLVTIFLLQRGLTKHIIQHGALNKKTLLIFGWFGKFSHGLEGLVGFKQTRGTCSNRLPNLSKQSYE